MATRRPATARTEEEERQPLRPAGSPVASAPEAESSAPVVAAADLYRVWKLAAGETVAALGVGVGDLLVLVLTRAALPDDLAGLAFVMMFEEWAIMTACALVNGMAVALIEAVSGGKAAEARRSRFAVLVAALAASVVTAGMLLVGQGPAVAWLGLAPGARAVVERSAVAVSLAVAPSIMARLLEVLLGAIDEAEQLVVVGVLEMVAKLAVFAALQPTLGVGAYAWASIASALVASIAAAALLARAEAGGEPRPRLSDVGVDAGGKAWALTLSLFLSLGLPSMVSVCVDLFSHYFVVIVAGSISVAEVVALRIAEGCVWPVLTTSSAVLESVAAMAATRVGEGDVAGGLRSLRLAWGLVVLATAAVASVVLVLPAELLALPFYDECGTAACHKSVELGRWVTIIALVVNVLDSARGADMLMLRCLLDSAAPAAVHAVSVAAVGVPLGLALAIPAGWGSIGTVLGRGVAMAVAAVGTRWLLNRALRSALEAAKDGPDSPAAIGFDGDSTV
ncbi:hypothetical protein FNF31_07935 [Cafeteria roenbergensis]|uniref:Protein DETOXIFICATION n=1 Tax=Cafeteria roenbergensis TaxID=33653 RepID=A0A5A8BZP0_CAFRO|nr:hypothetical protein FNF31_07935 [Cafeteria roenbergensis]